MRRAGGRFIFVDLGAGLFSTGGKTPGAVNGSSLKWFTWRYEQIGVTFDRIIAFEARAKIHSENDLSTLFWFVS